LFLAEVVAEAPVFQDEGEIRPQVAGRIHALGLTPNAGRRKHILETRPARNSRAADATASILTMASRDNAAFVAQPRQGRNLCSRRWWIWI
jgi:hypothetical protein